MKNDDTSILRAHNINPSAQRVAVANYVLHTEEHPSADEVWNRVRENLPQLSRATTYNTLNLFVEKGLLRRFVLTEGRVVFDPNTVDHHHFIDADSDRIIDIPWNQINVPETPKLEGFDVEEYMLVMRGKKKTN